MAWTVWEKVKLLHGHAGRFSKRNPGCPVGRLIAPGKEVEGFLPNSPKAKAAKLRAGPPGPAQ